MRVAMISSEKLPVPPVRGGAVQTYIAGVAPFLARQHEVTVLGIQDDSLPAEEVREGVRYVRLDATPNDRDSYLRALVAWLRSHPGFDVLVIFNRPMAVLPVHRASPGSRLVLSLHNEMFRETKIPPELARPTLDALARIVTVSSYIAAHVRVRYPEAAPKLQPLYSGVSLELFPARGTREADRVAAEARRELGMGPGPVILFLGRLSAKKGPDRLLDAMPLVLRRFPDARLCMVGSKWFGANERDVYVRSLWEKAQQLPGHVFFTGYVPYEEIHRYFALADVFVCPSQWSEPLARVHYEAMAAGLPIVTTARGGNPEVVQPGVNGLVVWNWHAPEAFAAAIIRLLNNPRQARAMGQQGRRIVEERFTFRRIAQALEGVLLEALRSPVPAVELPGRLYSGLLARPEAEPAQLRRRGLYADTLGKLRARTLTVLEQLPDGSSAQVP